MANVTTTRPIEPEKLASEVGAPDLTVELLDGPALTDGARKTVTASVPQNTLTAAVLAHTPSPDALARRDAPERLRALQAAIRADQTAARSDADGYAAMTAAQRASAVARSMDRQARMLDALADVLRLVARS